MNTSTPPDRQPATAAGTRTDDWLAALRTSSRRLSALVGGLSDDQLRQPSFSGDWSIAAVLSHLGSAAEICTRLVEEGIVGDPTGPRPDWLRPIWQRWDALSAPARREAWQLSDAAHLRALAAASAASSDGPVLVGYFSGPLDVAAYAGYRLCEQSVHGWDIEVALDAAATIPAPEVALLWDRLDLVATRFREADTLARLRPGQVAVRLTDSGRTACLDLNAELHLYPCEPAEPTGSLSGTAEAVLRLVCGRNRPADGLRTSGGITLDDLKSLFPGY